MAGWLFVFNLSGWSKDVPLLSSKTNMQHLITLNKQYTQIRALHEQFTLQELEDGQITLS